MVCYFGVIFIKGGYYLNNSQFQKGVIEVMVPFTMSLVLFVFLFYKDIMETLDFDFLNTIFLLLLGILVFYTDYKIFQNVKNIRQRKNGLIYLLIVGVIVVLFQVFFDMLKMDFENNFYFLFYDFMYNLSFCALFIIAFKFADIYYFHFFDRISK